METNNDIQLLIDYVKTLSNGYYAGEDVSDEVKEAWVKGFIFAANNYIKD